MTKEERKALMMQFRTDAEEQYEYWLEYMARI